MLYLPATSSWINNLRWHKESVHRFPKQIVIKIRNDKNRQLKQRMLKFTFFLLVSVGLQKQQLRKHLLIFLEEWNIQIDKYKSPWIFQAPSQAIGCFIIWLSRWMFYYLQNDTLNLHLSLWYKVLAVEIARTILSWMINSAYWRKMCY